MMARSALLLLACQCMGLAHAQEPDPTFGTEGVSFIDFGGDNDDAQDLIVQPDGRILVAGYARVNNATRAGVCRLLTDGSLDPSFGSGGKATVQVGQANTLGQTFALQPDGKMLIGGHYAVGSTFDLFVARLDANGTLDPSFGTGGIATHMTHASGALFWDMELQADGRILVTGQNRVVGNSALLTARLLPTGALDPSFGTGGVALNDPGTSNDASLSVAVQADGRIVLAGYSNLPGRREIVVLRMIADGSLDPAFGAGGIVNVNISNDEDFASDVVIQPDGKIVVVGHSTPSSDPDILAFRLLPDGGFDLGFGTNGVVLFDELFEQEADRVAIDGEGGLVICATVDATTYDLRVLRLLADGTPDPEYDATFHFSGDDAASAIAIQTDGKVLVAGENNDGAAAADMLVLRLGATGLNAVADRAARLPMSVSPNPVMNSLTVRAEGLMPDASLTITDQQGRVVASAPCNGTSAQTLDAGPLAPGTYSLSAPARQGQRTVRFIKQ